MMKMVLLAEMIQLVVDFELDVSLQQTKNEFFNQNQLLVHFEHE